MRAVPCMLMLHAGHVCLGLKNVGKQAMYFWWAPEYKWGVYMSPIHLKEQPEPPRHAHVCQHACYGIAYQ